MRPSRTTGGNLGYRSEGRPPRQSTRTPVAPCRPGRVWMRADQQLRVVTFAQFSPDWPGELFGGEREPGVDAGLVATWVLPVPTALQVHRDKSMHDVGGAVVGESLITQAGRDTFCPEQAGEQVGFGEAESDAFSEGLRGTQSDPRVLGIPGVTHPVTRVFERSLREGQIVGVLSPQGRGELRERGVGQVDDFIPGQVGPRGVSLQLHDLRLVASRGDERAAGGLSLKAHGPNL